MMSVAIRAASSIGMANPSPMFPEL